METDGDLRRAVRLGLLLLPIASDSGVSLRGRVLRYGAAMRASDRAVAVLPLLDAYEAGRVSESVRSFRRQAPLRQR